MFSFGVPAEKAVEVYGEVIAAGDTLLAAYTAAFNVAEEALRKSNKAEEEVEKLTRALPFCVTTSGTFALTLHTRCSSQGHEGSAIICAGTEATPLGWLVLEICTLSVFMRLYILPLQLFGHNLFLLLSSA